MMTNNKKIVSDKSVLFALTEAMVHYVKVSPESDEYLKVWIKEPTWLQIEKAMAAVMKINSKSQTLDLDMNAMYRYMVENFIEKTEPSLSSVDLIRLNPYVGSQLKEILPNPMNYIQGDEGKNE